MLDFRKIQEKKTNGAEGVWLEYTDGTEKEGDECTSIKVARLGRQFQAFVQGKLSSLKKSRRGASIDDALLDPRMEPIYREAYARFVVLDWRNVIGANGEQVAYSEKLGQEALEDPELFAWLRSCADDATNFHEQQQEADGGN